MSFLRVWLIGYYNPVSMIEKLRAKPAPQWGLYGVFLRAALDSLLLYLPLALMGRIPPETFVPFVPTYRAVLLPSRLVVAGRVWCPVAALVGTDPCRAQAHRPAQ